MKRSLQEVIELVVFGLIALLVGTGILWLLGWLLGFVSVLFTFIAGLIWALLRFIIPVAIVAGILFFIYKLFTREKPTPVVSSTAAPVVKSVADASHETPEELPRTEPPVSQNAENPAYPDENKN